MPNSRNTPKSPRMVKCLKMSSLPDRISDNVVDCNIQNIQIRERLARNVDYRLYCFATVDRIVVLQQSRSCLEDVAVQRSLGGRELVEKPERCRIIRRVGRDPANQEPCQQREQETATAPTATLSSRCIGLLRSACRSDGPAEIGSGQSLQEGDDCVGLVIRQHAIELRVTHFLHGLG